MSTECQGGPGNSLFESVVLFYMDNNIMHLNGA